MPRWWRSRREAGGASSTWVRAASGRAPMSSCLARATRRWSLAFVRSRSTAASIPSSLETDPRHRRARSTTTTRAAKGSNSSYSARPGSRRRGTRRPRRGMPLGPPEHLGIRVTRASPQRPCPMALACRVVEAAIEQRPGRRPQCGVADVERLAEITRPGLQELPVPYPVADGDHLVLAGSGGPPATAYPTLTCCPAPASPPRGQFAGAEVEVRPAWRDDALRARWVSP
jgi:hypothetical protein